MGDDGWLRSQGVAVIAMELVSGSWSSSLSENVNMSSPHTVPSEAASCVVFLEAVSGIVMVEGDSGQRKDGGSKER